MKNAGHLRARTSFQAEVREAPKQQQKSRGIAPARIGQ
jgi:hypothetical protein